MGGIERAWIENHRMIMPPLLESLEPRVLLSSCGFDVDVPAAGCPPLHARIDYRFDVNNFFDTSVKRDILEIAFDNVLRRLDDELAAINPRRGSSWHAQFTHPSLGTDVALRNLSIAENELLVFVGGQPLGEAAGAGGPGGFEVVGANKFVNTVSTRGQIRTQGKRATDFGPWGGSITFDSETRWHFGQTTSGLASNELDFLSVATHEIFHLLGFGSSHSWSHYVDAHNAVFTGPASLAQFDQLEEILLHVGANGEPDLSHWAESVQDDNNSVSMAAKLRKGSRVLPTELDFAGLADVGWEVRQDSRIHGTVWVDVDGNGQRGNQDLGIEYWTVFLDSNGNGVLDDDESSTRTDKDGLYSFTGLMPGTYRIRQVVRQGFAPTFAHGGIMGPAHQITLDVGQVEAGLDFGNFQYPLQPDLVGNVVQMKFPETIVPQDRGLATVLVSNVDTLPVNELVGVQVVASINDQVGDVDDFVLGHVTKRLKLKAMQDTPGIGKLVRVGLRVPGDVVPGDYKIFVVVDADGQIEERNELNNIVLGDETVRTVKLGFGQINHRFVKSVTVNGVHYRFKGVGTGDIHVGADGQADSITLNGTSNTSSLRLRAGRGVLPRLEDLTINGSARAIDARRFHVEGDVFVSGILAQLSVGDMDGRQLLTIEGTDPNEKVKFSLRADHVRDLSIYTPQLPIGSIKVKDWVDTEGYEGMITAPHIGLIRSNQDFSANLTLTDDLARFSLRRMIVRKDLLGSEVRTHASLGSITAGRIIDSAILAGVGDLVGRPDTPGDFVSQASISSMTVRGIRGETAQTSFRNSYVVAFAIGSVKLRDVEVDNLGVEFGIVAGSSISSIRRAHGPRLSKLALPGVFDREGDFSIQII